MSNVPDLRPVVARFAGLMEMKLRQHDATRGPAGWRTASAFHLADRLREEVNELEEALTNASTELEVMHEAADVANLAMMIADLLGPALPDHLWETAPFPRLPGRVVTRTVVCLCGSTRLWRIFQKAGLEETMQGRIVLSIGAASGTDDAHFGNLPQAEYDRIKTNLDNLHFDKIRMADEVLILNGTLDDGTSDYIGESTRRELALARELGKVVRWYYYPSAHALPGESFNFNGRVDPGPGRPRIEEIPSC